MSLLHRVAEDVNRRGRPTTVRDLMPGLRGFKPRQVAMALRTAAGRSLINRLQQGDPTTPAIYGPKAP